MRSTLLRPSRVNRRRRVGMAGSPFESFSPSHGSVTVAARRCSRAASSVGSPSAARPGADERDLQQPLAVACSSGTSPAYTSSSSAVPLGLCAAHRGLAAALGGLVLRALGDRTPVHLDELVDQPGGRGAGSDHDGGPGAVRVDRRGGERRDRELVQVAADDDARAGRTERVELLAGVLGEVGQVAGVDADRTEFRAGRGDRVRDALRDVVGVDEQRRARAERVELGGERRLSRRRAAA